MARSVVHLGESPRLYYLYPEVRDPEQYRDDFYRALFYLSPLVRRGDTVLVASALADRPYDHPPRDYLDDRVAEVATELRDSVECLAPEEANRRFDGFGGQRVVCLWDETLRNADPFLKRYNGDITVIRADHRRVQNASSQYLKASSQDGFGTPEQRSVSERRLRELIQRLSRDRVLIFGTGPSLGGIDFDSLPEGVHIATNSMVINRPLLERMRPQLIVASDPIFHAGVSSYAGAFRRLLVEAMRAYDASFIFPMRDIGIYQTLLPQDVQHRLIGVPIVGEGNLNLDLTNHCTVAATRNVMTLFLLPLASSLARETVMLGFDGRPPGDNDYFWAHSEAFQLVDHMQAIRQAHPAFFEIDYDEYYREHCEKVELYLRQMEAQGHTVLSLTDSYIPAVKGRFVAGRAAPFLAQPLGRPEVSVLMPLDAELSRVKAAVHSVQAQSLGDWELICIDGGQRPEVSRWIAGEAARDRRLLPLQATGDGLAEALNRGLAAASGHYLCFLHGRDCLTMGSLKRRMDLLRADPTLEVCGGRVELVDSDGRALGVRRGRPVVGRLRDARSSIFHIDSLFGVAQVMKRYRFDPERPFGESWAYVVQIMRFGRAIGSCGEEPVAELRVETAEQVFGVPRTRYRSIEAILDELLNPPPSPLYAEGPPRPLSSIQIDRSKARRLQSLFVGQVFRGDEAGVRAVIELMAEVPSVPFLQPVDPAFFETRAAQVFLQPVGSAALFRRVAGRYEAVFAACRALRAQAPHRDFAVGFQVYAMQIARQVALMDGVAPPAGEEVRRVWRQAKLLYLKNHLQTFRYQAGTIYRDLRDDGVTLGRRLWSGQRAVRRRLRKWRRERRRLREAV